jgi:nucleoside-diphosphate-sugar epimerase
MRALLTGGTGFIGSRLAAALAAAGHEVHALIRDPGSLKLLAGVPVRLVPGGLPDPPTLPPGLDRVFHIAGLTKSLKTEDYFSVNRDGTASLLEALIRGGQRPRFVYLSSLAAAGPLVDGRPRREDDPPSPVSPYGRSKLAGEAEVLARAGRVPSVILRVGAVYGPGDPEIARLFRLVRRGWLPLFGPRRQPLSVCYVEDLVRALILAGDAATEPGEIFNIGDPRPSCLEEMGRRAAGRLDRRIRAIPVPMPLVRAAAVVEGIRGRLTGRASLVNRQKVAELRQAGWTAEVGKARRRLGFETAWTLDEGLAATVDWYLAQGWI